MGSLPQLRKVLETGGEATVTRSWNNGERGDADGADDETKTGGDEADGARVQASDEEGEGGILNSVVQLTQYNRSYAARTHGALPQC